MVGTRQGGGINSARSLSEPCQQNSGHGHRGQQPNPLARGWETIPQKRPGTSTGCLTSRLGFRRALPSQNCARVQGFGASQQSCGSQCWEPGAASRASAGAGPLAREGCRQLGFKKDQIRSGAGRVCSLVSETHGGAGPSPRPPEPSTLPSYVGSMTHRLEEVLSSLAQVLGTNF